MGHLSTVVVALLVALSVSCWAAPTATIIQPAAHQYYLIQPQPATLKIQPSLIQPIQQLKLEPKQYVYYYPSVPLATTTTTTHQYTESGKPIRLIALKQEEGGNGGNWWSSVFGFFQPATTEMPAGESETTEAPAAAAQAAPEKKLMFMAPPNEKPSAETPASTSGLPQRYYILSGTPQFYGNFDALQNPLSPIFSLQPLQAIHARGANSADIQAEDEQLPRFQAQIVSSLAPIAPVPAAVPAQLKNDLLESHQDKEQTIDRAWARSLDDEQLPAPEQQQQQQQQQIVMMLEEEPVIVQGRSKVAPEPEGEEQQQQQQQQQIVADEEVPESQQPQQRSVNDPAIAAVKPSGNFFDEEEDDEKKKKTM
ncbi:probable serine/threonine-protein kinase fhkB isoform X2 [Anopheles albimanus]|uniref:probable serine/threonine-protein kinase fhkB isoform X2 n=1 Tax=Anopheles albimanus TaxID=7167 RepID=UPI0016412DF5|nr:probable serine/threonine-protein kinase fhkB isoform X2 [Anopheles albimanus]